VELRLRAVSDPHAPAEYRINGVVVNMPEFEKAFNCTIGSAMAPLKRCRVWRSLRAIDSTVYRHPYVAPTKLKPTYGKGFRRHHP
jgi:Peptidase family M13